jgi:hypothetical protein
LDFYGLITLMFSSKPFDSCWPLLDVGVRRRVRGKVWLVQRQQIGAKCSVGERAARQCGWIGKLPCTELGHRQSSTSGRGLRKASSTHLRGKQKFHIFIYIRLVNFNIGDKKARGTSTSTTAGKAISDECAAVYNISTRKVHDKKKTKT